MNNLKKFDEFLNESVQDDTYTIIYENPTFIEKINDGDFDEDEDDFGNDDYDFGDIIDIVIDDFNETELEQYLDDNLSKKVITIRAEESNSPQETFLIKVKVKGVPSKEDIYDIKNYISGQCSDGWGEGFEQQDTNGYSVSTWSMDGPHIKFIKIEKED